MLSVEQEASYGFRRGPVKYRSKTFLYVASEHLPTEELGSSADQFLAVGPMGETYPISLAKVSVARMKSIC